MKPIVIVFIILAAAASIRAVADLYEIMWLTKSQIDGASVATKDCDKIDALVSFEDKDLQSDINSTCQKRKKLSERWFLTDSVTTWIAGLWLCDNLHCSEYVMPLVESIMGTVRYSVIITIGAILLVVYLSIPVLQNLLIDYFRSKNPQYSPYGLGGGQNTIYIPIAPNQPHNPYFYPQKRIE